MGRKLLLLAVLVIAIVAFVVYPRAKNYVDPEGEIDFNAGSLITLRPTDTPNKEIKEVPYKVTEVVRGLKVPWSIAFTSATRILVTERMGSVRLVENGELKATPLITFPETSHTGEAGLLGIVLDPDYERNKFVYVDVAYTKGGKMVEKIVRLKDLGNTLVEDKIIFDNIPAAVVHDGGALAFGPDGKLYITTGDATNKNDAQNPNSLAGKILRLNSDGSVPSDNPSSGSAVWSMGHRNPQGIAWYPDSRVLWATEHGPSGNDGPGGGDEVNVIEQGANYGWPTVSHTTHKDGLVDPKIVFTPAVAPASAMFYTGKTFPQFKNNLFFGALRGEGIFRVVVDASAPSQVVSYGKLPDVNLGRIRNVSEGPDGAIYFTTSNTDGRGSAREGDDKIYKLVVDK